MLDQRTIFASHRRAHEGLAGRKIAKPLGRRRHTTSHSLDAPNPQRPLRPRPSQRDPCTDEIARLLASAPKVSAAVRRQRLTDQGCAGGLAMVRADLRGGRGATKQPPPVMRFASAPDEQGQIDSGHFGSLAYGATQRTLSCLAVLECPSRLLSLEFTHSQRPETLHRGLRHTVHFFQGTPKELVHDNMRTAVLERQGPVVRCHEHLGAFVRPCHLTPVACTGAQPQAKGQVEQGAMHYLRHNCWPLSTLRALTDLPGASQPVARSGSPCERPHHHRPAAHATLCSPGHAPLPSVGT